MTPTTTPTTTLAPTTTEADETTPGAAAAAPRPPSPWLAPRRLVTLGVLAAVFVWGLTWIPGLMFWIGFQLQVTSGETGVIAGALLEAVPRPVDVAPFAGGGLDEPAAWPRALFDDVLVPLPPGEIVGVQATAETLVALYGRGAVTIDRFPAGLLRTVFLEEMRRIGASAGPRARALAASDDGAILLSIARSSPADFHLGMSGEERSVYAASLCAKLRLWDVETVVSARAFVAPSAVGVVFVEGPARAKAVLTSPAGTFVYTVTTPEFIDGDAAAAQWTDVRIADDAGLDAWRAATRKLLGEDHPLLGPTTDGAAAPVDR